MKTIELKVGTHNVRITVTPIPHEHRIEYVATCGRTTVGPCNQKLQQGHSHTPEQFAKDIEEFAQRLAEEAAGHEQGRALVENYFK